MTLRDYIPTHVDRKDRLTYNTVWHTIPVTSFQYEELRDIYVNDLLSLIDNLFADCYTLLAEITPRFNDLYLDRNDAKHYIAQGNTYYGQQLFINIQEELQSYKSSLLKGNG